MGQGRGGGRKKGERRLMAGEEDGGRRRKAKKRGESQVEAILPSVTQPLKPVRITSSILHWWEQSQTPLRFKERCRDPASC